MLRSLMLLFSALVVLGASGCGGGSGTPSKSSGGGTPSEVPMLAQIAPSSTVTGAPSLSILAYGSNFQDSAAIAWNGTPLPTECVDDTLAPTACSAAAALQAQIPATDFASAGTAKVTVVNPSFLAGSAGGTSNALAFSILQPQTTATSLVRAVAGISAPGDMVMDAARGRIYVSSTAGNVIAVVDPVAGSVTASVPAPGGPDQLSISSDGGYLWAGMDTANSVQRYLLPGISQDISISLPLDGNGHPQEAVALQAAPVNPHTLGLIAGHFGYSPPGDGVYVYDDATQRTNFVPSSGTGGAWIDWLQWGADDSTIYGNQYTTIDAGGIASLSVNAAGVTLANYGGGLDLQMGKTQYERSNGLLYSYGGAYDPAKLSLMGSFSLPATSAEACTADTGLARYYCVTTYFYGSSDVIAFELWVFDLNSYSLISRTFLGATAGTTPSSVTGAPVKMLRWGNAGLAVLTVTDPYFGNGGLFLIDGAAVNPNVVPDVTGGTSTTSYASLSSMTPDFGSSSSGTVQVTIQGNGFSPDSTACWNCSFLQFRFLPTTYVSPTQLSVTIPVNSVSSTQPLEVSVFDQAAQLFSLNALTFTVLPNSGTTRVMPVNLCGLSMAWDSNTQLLYVGTADYDGAYPNDVVGLDPTSGAVVKAQAVEPDPMFLTESAEGQYLYAAYSSATNLTQLALPALNATVTAPLRDSYGNTWLPGDLKAAPQNPHTVAATLIVPGWTPEALGGITLYDDGTPRPDSLPGWTKGQTVPAMYDTLAWSASDQLLTSSAAHWDASESSPLYLLQVDSSGPSYLGQGSTTFPTTYLHSDFGTGLIYSDGGQVADPHTGAIVGSYNASGLLAPDSSLNRVFILGQTQAQANTFNYTIESFDQKAFTPVSSITLNNISGAPVEMVRWGTSGLAVLTMGGMVDVYADGSGMLYLIQDAAFVSNAPPAAGAVAAERIQQRWREISKRERLEQMRRTMLHR